MALVAGVVLVGCGGGGSSSSSKAEGQAAVSSTSATSAPAPASPAPSGAGGSSGGASAKGKVKESTTTTTIAKGPDTTAAVLRSKLNGLLEEHVYLASAATGAALGGRADEFTAAAAALDGNSNALTGN